MGEEWLGRHLVKSDMIYGTFIKGVMVYTDGLGIVLSMESERETFTAAELLTLLEKLIRVCAVAARVRRAVLEEQIEKVKRLIAERGESEMLRQELQTLEQRLKAVEKIIQLEEVVRQ